MAETKITGLLQLDVDAMLVLQLLLFGCVGQGED